MKAIRSLCIALLLITSLCFAESTDLGVDPSGHFISTADYSLQAILQFNVGMELGQCRAVPVDLGDEDGIFLAYCQDAEVDPYVEMFFFPKHRMKISVYTHSGKEVWTKELGPGVIPGIWFVPFFPFDLDGDGVDEIWFVVLQKATAKY